MQDYAPANLPVQTNEPTLAPVPPAAPENDLPTLSDLDEAPPGTALPGLTPEATQMQGAVDVVRVTTDVREA